MKKINLSIAFALAIVPASTLLPFGVPMIVDKGAAVKALAEFAFIQTTVPSSELNVARSVPNLVAEIADTGSKTINTTLCCLIEDDKSINCLVDNADLGLELAYKSLKALAAGTILSDLSKAPGVLMARLFWVFA